MNAKSRTILQRLGVSPGTPYVCVAIRDASYYARAGTRESKGYPILNFELATFEAAVRRLTAHGYVVVRMGTPTSNTLPELPGFIDYANSPSRDELSDIVLIRDCEFVLSDYCTTTAAMVQRPWREWLRTYRAHERGTHYFSAVGEQDITVEVPIDQLSRPLRSPHRLSFCASLVSTVW